MKILIVGAGLSGCTVARLLKDKGHDVSLIEKESYIGGLCITRINEDGLKYEPFGARTFHTNDPKTKEFVNRFDHFNGYVHRKGMIINNKLFPFPLFRGAINDFEERDKIIEELNSRPKVVDKTNFERAAISIFGKTLYGYFIENYTAKMWGMPPRELTVDWVPKRLELGDDRDDALFKNQWQGLPVNGYSHLLEKMIQGIPISMNTSHFNKEDYDVVVSSAPIDEIMGYCFGKLHYRSLDFRYEKNESWENDSYGTINLPQHPRYIRKCNFNVLHRERSRNSLIQYQEPVEADEKHLPMYPVNTDKNHKIFEKYLTEMCRTNICPIGRLGLFKYLDMDKAVSAGFDMIPIVENFLLLRTKQKIEGLKNIVQSY